MRKRLGWIVAGVGFIVWSAQAQETPRRVMAEELLNLMNMPETIEKSFAMMKQMMPTQMEKMTQATGQTNLPSNVTREVDSLMDLMAQEFSWNKIKADYITLYAETFTEEEMKGIIAFYKSPAGLAFTKKQPELMKRSLELSQKIMMQIMPKIQSITHEQRATTSSSTVREKENR
jgi:uncharacterized protein